MSNEPFQKNSIYSRSIEEQVIEFRKRKKNIYYIMVIQQKRTTKLIHLFTSLYQ